MYPIQIYTYLNSKDINANKCILIYYEYKKKYIQYKCKVRKILMQTNVNQRINEHGWTYPILMYTYVKFKIY